MRTALLIMAFAFIGSAACSKSGPLDAMQPGEHGRVVRIIDGDALVLDTGQAVRLVGIEAPVLHSRYDDPAPYAEEASRALEDLVMGRQVQIFYPGLTRDRYDRALAHLQTADGAGPKLWVNLELIREGAVRVRLYPDTDSGGETLMAAEAEAQAARRGLWALRVYAPVEAASLEADRRGFTLVEGVLGPDGEMPEEDEYRHVLCTRRMEHAGLVVDMEFTARPACDTPAGTPVRLRGWVSDGRMELVHPLHIETLPQP